MFVYQCTFVWKTLHNSTVNGVIICPLVLQFDTNSNEESPPMEQSIPKTSKERVMLDIALQESGEFRQRVMPFSPKVKALYEILEIQRNQKPQLTARALQRCFIEGVYLILASTLYGKEVPTIKLVKLKKQPDNQPIELALCYAFNAKSQQLPEVCFKEFINRIFEENTKLKQNESQLIADLKKRMPGFTQTKLPHIVASMETAEIFLSESILTRMKHFCPMLRLSSKLQGASGKVPGQLELNILNVRKYIEEIFMKDNRPSAMINVLPLSQVRTRIEKLAEKLKSENCCANSLREIAEDIYKQMLQPGADSFEANIYEQNLLEFMNDLGLTTCNQLSESDRKSPFWTFRYSVTITIPHKIPCQNENLVLEMRYSQKKMLEVFAVSDLIINVENKDFIQIKSMTATEEDIQIDGAVPIYETKEAMRGRYLTFRKYARYIEGESVIFSFLRLMDMAACIFCVVKDEFSTRMSIQDSHLNFEGRFSKKVKHYTNWLRQKESLTKPQQFPPTNHL